MSETGTERKFVSLNDFDPADTGVTEEFNPNANPFAFAPPTPGRYLVKLSFTEQDPEKRWEVKPYNAAKYPEKAGLYYLATRLSGQIAEGDFEGRFVNDGFVSTGIFGNQQTSTIAGILRNAGYDLTGLNGATLHKDMAQMFEEYIASEPTCTVRVDWEWRGSAENIDEDTGFRKVLKGARHFAEGSFEREDDVTGELIKARAIIAGYVG